LFGPFSKVPGTAETNVAVGIRGRIVQIQSEDAGVGSVVPITAALESPHRRFVRRHPSPARQMIAPFSDYASGEADKSAKTDLSAAPENRNPCKGLTLALARDRPLDH